MKKQYLFMSAILLTSLVGCANNSSNSGEPLTIYDENAKFVVSGYGVDVLGNNEWFPLATYHHKNNGEAPYVEVGQFLDIMNNTFHNVVDYETMTSTRVPQYDSSIIKISDHLYGIYSESVLGARLDTNENVLTIDRFDYMFTQIDAFNGTLRSDVATPNNSRTSAVHGSSRSNYKGEYKSEVYDLDDYNMDIVELNDKVYMPAQLLSNILLRSMGADFVYNGNDFFISSNVGSDSTSYALSGSFRSSNNTFEISGDLYSSSDPQSNEEYRYTTKVSSSQEEVYGIFSLDKEGHGYAFTGSTPNATDTSNATYKLDWVKNNGDIYIALYGKDTTGQFLANGHVMRVSSNETFYNKKNRSAALSEFNYQLLRFQIDNFYGLKEEFNTKYGFTDFDSFVKLKGLKDKLLSTDTRTYDEGLSEFLMKYVDDGHTRYSDRSVFSGKESVSSKDLVNRYIGSRRGTLLSKHDEYVAYRASVSGLGDKTSGVFFEGETAVIRFDGFMHPLPIISDPGPSLDILDMTTIMNASSPFGFVKAFKEIANHSEVKNIVIDLTCNGGGMVLTLPFLASYFMKDPTIYVKDMLSGMVREYHYDVDTNMDGIYNGPGDYLGDKYHFYLLTSDFSFSCASAFPTMAYSAGIDIIGIRCGGGACNVAGFTDACGSIYTLSAPQQIGYLDKDGNFVNDDAGIPVTHELAKENWYDLVKLNQAVTGFSNN